MTARKKEEAAIIDWWQQDTSVVRNEFDKADESRENQISSKWFQLWSNAYNKSRSLVSQFIYWFHLSLCWEFCESIRITSHQTHLGNGQKVETSVRLRDSYTADHWSLQATGQWLMDRQARLATKRREKEMQRDTEREKSPIRRRPYGLHQLFTALIVN